MPLATLNTEDHHDHIYKTFSCGVVQRPRYSYFLSDVLWKVNLQPCSEIAETLLPKALEEFEKSLLCPLPVSGRGCQGILSNTLALSSSAWILIPSIKPLYEENIYLLGSRPVPDALLGSMPRLSRSGASGGHSARRASWSGRGSAHCRLPKLLAYLPRNFPQDHRLGSWQMERENRQKKTKPFLVGCCQ